jgi:hypothetical protein
MTARRLLSPLFAAALAALVAAGACRGGPEPVPAAQEARGPTRAAPASPDEVERVADRLMARARAHEPAVSALLGRLAAEVGGRLAGFEHRLKTRASLLRKMRKLLHDHPAWTAADVVINDALRYTIEVGDAPPGQHARAIRTALAALESAGHRVTQVKNYWPRGDNYSGVNSVLIAPDGLEWELQFHTPESFATKMRDYHLYEELREETTPRPRKRLLYDRLSAPWESVPIPQHILEPMALHRSEEIILRPPP